MASIAIHPSELAYAFSYARAEDILGWGMAPFLPKDETVAADWLSVGEEKMLGAGRLVGAREDGLNFTDETSDAVLALVDPVLVLMAERKAGDGLRRYTVHASGQTFVGLMRRTDGTFELTRYSDLTAAAGACAGFLGATFTPIEEEARVETSYDNFARIHAAGSAGRVDAAASALIRLGMTETNATSAAEALARPAAAGVLSVLYCAANVVQDVEAFSVFTGTGGQTWILFSPASSDGPTVLERASVADLTARVAVGVAARLTPAS